MSNLSLREMLGMKHAPRKSQMQLLEAKYMQCRQQIDNLFNKIKCKLEEKDDCILSKFNEQYDARLKYEASSTDEKECKYSQAPPTGTPPDIPSHLRPSHVFPMSTPDETGKAYAKFRLQRTIKGHNDKIYALKWSSDNKNIVSASKNGCLLVTNMESYTQKLAIPLRQAWVMTVDYSQNGELIASGGLDNMVSIFNIKDRIGWASDMLQPHIELQQHEGYVSCARFVDDEHILTSSGDSNCILWNLEYQQPISVFIGHTGDVSSVAHNVHTQNTFISGSIDSTAKLWDYRLKSQYSCIKTFTGHVSDVNCVEWFPDYKAFGTASEDGCCRLFDLNSYQTVNIYGHKLPEANGVTSLGFSKSGYYLAAAYDDGPGCLAWNTVTAKIEKHLPHSTKVSSLEFQPNGNSLVTGCWDGRLRVWV